MRYQYLMRMIEYCLAGHSPFRKEASRCLLAGETHKCGALKYLEAKRYKGCWESNEYKVMEM